MAEEIHIEDFLRLGKKINIADVRSPAEYEQGHIPGAINIPLFTNEERSIVGTLYKNKGRKEAIAKGMEITAFKLAYFTESARKIQGNGQLLVHCWRGGMRSAAMAWWFERSGIKCHLLKGGYKSYRRYVLEHLEKKFPLIVLGGMTGSGKTAILHEISRQGEQVLDLEDLANHKGSAFGALGEDIQPTTEQFENNISHVLNTFDPSRPVWVEDESRNIGRVTVPAGIFHRMQESTAIIIEPGLGQRVQRLVKVYGNYPPAELKNCIWKIHKRLGGLNTQKAVDAIENGDYELVAKITLGYYDKTYRFGLNKKQLKNIHYIRTSHYSPVQNAKMILEYFHNNLGSGA